MFLGSKELGKDFRPSVVFFQPVRCRLSASRRLRAEAFSFIPSSQDESAGSVWTTNMATA